MIAAKKRLDVELLRVKKAEADPVANAFKLQRLIDNIKEEIEDIIFKKQDGEFVLKDGDRVVDWWSIALSILTLIAKVIARNYAENKMRGLFSR